MHEPAEPAWRELSDAEFAALQPFILNGVGLSQAGCALLREAEGALTRLAVEARIAGFNSRRNYLTDEEAQAAFEAEMAAITAGVVGWLNEHMVPLLPREVVQ